MKIIVIGATGTIGSEVAKAFSQKKHEVVGALEGFVRAAALEMPRGLASMPSVLHGSRRR
jgi:uncharacterized protein YbjT (DUF2867 family)